jgi:hypothetical protein
MDEVLSAPGADVAWGLRFWERTSFKQLGEEETRLLVRVFLRRFGNTPGITPLVAKTHAQLGAMFNPAVHTAFEMSELVASAPASYVTGDELNYEFVLHGLIVEAMDPFPGRSGDLATPLRLDVYREIAASPQSRRFTETPST